MQHRSNMAILNLGHLSVGITVLAALGHTSSTFAEQTRDMHAMLEQLQAAAQTVAAVHAADAARLHEAQRQIDAAIAAIEQAQSTVCYEQAVGYIAVESGSTPGVFAETVTLKIVGSHGHWYFTFAAGKTIESAVEQINSMTSWTYASAAISAMNPHRIEVRSSHYFMEQNYLEIKQVSGVTPIVYATAVGGNAMLQWLDYGCSIGVPVCANAAALYLSSTGANGDGPTTIIVQGYRGMQMFTFASGTTVNTVAAAVQTMSPWSGVTATPLNTYPYRARLESTFLGSAGFVSVMQVGGTPPIVYAKPQGGTPTYSLLTHGLDRLAGDVNCDRIVNAIDLALVVRNWGDCPLPPFVCETDLTNDGTVNLNDLLQVMDNWGAVD